MSLSNREVVGVVRECADLAQFVEQAKIVISSGEYHDLKVELTRYAELHKKKNSGAENLNPAEKQEKLLLKQKVYEGLKNIQLS